VPGVAAAVGGVHPVGVHELDGGQPHRLHVQVHLSYRRVKGLRSYRYLNKESKLNKN
jgi:hypothetical protein